MVVPLSGGSQPTAKPTGSLHVDVKALLQGVTLTPRLDLSKTDKRIELPLETKYPGSFATLLKLVLHSHVDERFNEAIEGFKNFRNGNLSMDIGICHVGLNRFQEFSIKNLLAFQGPFGHGITVAIGSNGKELTINRVPESELSENQKKAIWAIITTLKVAPNDEKRINAAMFALQLATDLQYESEPQETLGAICAALATYAATGVRDLDILKPSAALQNALEYVKSRELLITINELLEFLK